MKTMGAIMPFPMPEALQPVQLYRLMAWLSPAFPVGAFSYSSGLEWAVEAGDITDAATLQRWLRTMIAQGNGFCDGVFFVQAYRAVAGADEAQLLEVAELAAAFTPSKERQLETTAQGQAFLQMVRVAWSCDALDRFAEQWKGAVAYPVAVAVATAGHGIPLEAALHAYSHAVASNLISAGVRLIPLGQTDGQRVLAGLQEIIQETCGRALTASFDDLGSAAFRADLASMRHESQYTRLFRS
jgi:urease accessory protein